MEKTIKCPECGDDVTPEYGLCPVCSYHFELIDYKSQGVEETDFISTIDIKINSSLFGKIKVFGFLFVLFLIIFFLFNKLP